MQTRNPRNPRNPRNGDKHPIISREKSTYFADSKRLARKPRKERPYQKLLNLHANKIHDPQRWIEVFATDVPTLWQSLSDIGETLLEINFSNGAMAALPCKRETELRSTEVFQARLSPRDFPLNL